MGKYMSLRGLGKRKFIMVQLPEETAEGSEVRKNSRYRIQGI